MNTKHFSFNINPKVLDDIGEVNFGINLLETVQTWQIFNKLVSMLDTQSLINFQLSTKVFKTRIWRTYFKRVLYDRLLNPLAVHLISSSIDQRCSQFMYWDLIIDFKRVNIQYSHVYKYYSCQQSAESVNIQKDIERTFSNHQFFKQMHNRQKLQRILIALSKLLPQLGYVQGLNQIAGYFMLNGVNEQQTFWLIYYFMKKMKIQTIFANSFEELKSLNFIVAVFLRNLMPEFSQSLITHEIDISFITTRWFLTLFSYDLPQQLLFMVWNLFLLKGIKVLVRFSLALFRFISTIDTEDLYAFMKEDLVEVLEDPGYQKQVMEYFQEIKVTNTLLGELRHKHEVDEDACILSFDSLTKKYYWRQGGSQSARSLISSFNEVISEIYEEKDSSYVNSQSFLHVLFPRIINRQYQVASEGKKTLLIKTEKRPQFIIRQKVTTPQFKMCVPQSAFGDQEPNINADELQSHYSPMQDDGSIDIECRPKPFKNFIVPLVQLK